MKLDTDKFFFSHSVANKCNILSAEIVEKNSLQGFKRLDRHLRNIRRYI